MKTFSIITLILLFAASLIGTGISSGYEIYSITHYIDWTYDITLLLVIIVPVSFGIGLTMYLNKE